MKSRILFINPPIYDFSAYDFWLKPYGILSIAGAVQDTAEIKLFDYLDRQHPFMAAKPSLKSDDFGRGRFYEQKLSNPAPLKHIPRYWRRFGLPREFFQDFLQSLGPQDFALIQTTMTYWYPGVSEVIEDLRRIRPETKIVLGGNYAILCPEHARTLDPDFLLTGTALNPLWQYLDIEPDLAKPPCWQFYPKLLSGVIKLTEGCPFKCTYCSVPQVYGPFRVRDMNSSLTALELLARLKVPNIAFYDDALLCKPVQALIPFLEASLTANIQTNYHSPNALNARFLTAEIAELMVRAGFKTFYLGFESHAKSWQRQTGAKVYSHELAAAVSNLKNAGANPNSITAYQILGHPDNDTQQLESSMRFVHSLGIRGTLADFSPIPGTVDGRKCAEYVNLSEPLMHNKTAFPIILLGNDRVNYLKDLQRKLNRSLSGK